MCVSLSLSVPQAKKEHESSNFFFRFRRRPLAGTGLHGCRGWGTLDVSGANLVGIWEDPCPWLMGDPPLQLYIQPQERGRKKKARGTRKKKKLFEEGVPQADAGKERALSSGSGGPNLSPSKQC